jgi:integrase
MVPNVHKALRGVFDHALQREYLEFNPSLGLTKVIPDLKLKSRDRVLTEAEIKHVWHSLDESVVSRALKLILVTAQRPGEVAGLHRNEIENSVWTIPKERAEKGRGDHVVPLTKTALELIGAYEGPIFDVKRNSLSQVLSRDKKYFDLLRWTPHDLRRTARTFMAKIGVPEEHAEAILNHAKQGMKKVYNKYEYQEEKKAALLKWEAELLRIVS